MKTNTIIALFSLCSAAAFAQGTAFTYQGQLNSAAGSVSGLYDFQFAVYDSPSGGAQIAGTIVTNGVAVANGLFTITLDFGANLFTGNARWLDLAAHTNNSPNAFVSMTPRQQLTPAPYAIYSANSAGVSGLTLRQVSGTDASDLIAGSPSNTIDAGVRGAVIAGGGTASSSLTNRISSDFSTIGGGDGNTIQAGAQNSFIGGGGNNVITNGSYFSVIVGGSLNSLGNSDQYSFIGGGLGNHVDSAGGVLVGGSDNNLSGGGNSFMGGGINNHIISSSESFLGGGSGNTIQQFDGDSVLVGGKQNVVGAIYSFLGGGLLNTNQGQYASLVGGKNNSATGNGSFVGGGGFASVIGNLGNTASGEASVVSGGIRNTAMGNESAVGGGSANTAQGQYSMVPGGSLNLASGMFSFAAGNQGKATNNGAFVWADSQAADFSSTNNDSFNVRAQGGVRFVTGGAGVTVDGVPLPGSSSSGIVVQQNSDGAPNVIEGSPVNFVSSGVEGATIGGGGTTNYFGNSYSNSVTAYFGTVAGGRGNNAGGQQGATIGGGEVNSVSSFDGTVAGGQANKAAGQKESTVGGGLGNQATGSWATVPGGTGNLASAEDSFAAGQQAQAVNQGAFVWADSQNAAFASTNDDSFNVRAQGGVNFVTGGAGVTVDGVPLPGSSSSSGIVIQQNSDASPNIIEGSSANFVSSGIEGATIGGGGTTNYFGNPRTNSVTTRFGTVSGGVGNTAGGDEGTTVGGGELNTASGFASTVAGGLGNTASGSKEAAIGGGLSNRAGGTWATIPGGLNNNASSEGATVAGGENNTASGRFSFAAGQQAQAAHEGAFVWADSQNAPFTSTTNDQFLIRAQGGMGINTAATPDSYFSINTNTYLFSHAIYLRGETGSDHNHGLAYNGNTVTNFGTGQYQVDGPALWGFGGGVLGTRNGGDHAAVQWDTASVTVNGTFNNNSDRNSKQDFASVTPAEILEKVSRLPVSEWSYKTDANTRHIGPMAQDFHSTFNVGTDDRHIAPIDEGGVALAAIQGLNEKLNVKDTVIRQQTGEIAELKSRLDALEKIVRNQK